MGTLSSLYPDSTAVESSLNRANSAAHDVSILNSEMIDVLARLLHKQDTLSADQLIATNSGITSQLVNQIGLNASEIEALISGLSEKANESDLIAIQNTIAKLINFTTPEMYGAVGDGVTDDSVAIKNMFNYGISHNIHTFIFTKPKYVVSGVTTETDYGYFYKFTNKSNIKILGSSVIKWVENISDLTKSFGILAFEGCSDVDIEIGGESTAYTTSTNHPIIAAIQCVRNNFRFNVTLNCNNLRYGFRSGIFNNQNLISNQGIVNSKFNIKGTDVGYLFSAELGSYLDVEVYGEGFHRIAYFAGVDHVNVKTRGKTTRGAGNLVRFTDSNYIDVNNVRQIKGCSFINVDATDTGSHNADNTVNAIVGFASYGSDMWQRANDVTFSNVTAKIKCENGGLVAAVIFQDNNQTTYFKDMDFFVVDENTDVSIYQYVLQLNSSGINEESVMENVNFTIKAGAKQILVGTKSDNIQMNFKDCDVFRTYIDTAKTGKDKYIFENHKSERISPLNTSTKDTNKTVILKNCILTRKFDSFIGFEKYAYYNDMLTHGSTTDRPVTPNVGYLYFDETLTKLIYYAEYGVWKDLEGNIV